MFGDLRLIEVGLKMIRFSPLDSSGGDGGYIYSGRAELDHSQSKSRASLCVCVCFHALWQCGQREIVST